MMTNRTRWAFALATTLFLAACGSSPSGSHLAGNDGGSGNPGDPGTPPPPPIETTDHVFTLDSTKPLNGHVVLAVGFEGDADETMYDLKPQPMLGATVHEKQKKAHAFVLVSGAYASPEDNGLKLYRDGVEITKLVDNEGRHDFAWDPANMGNQPPPPATGTSIDLTFVFSYGGKAEDAFVGYHADGWEDYRIADPHRSSENPDTFVWETDGERSKGTFFGEPSDHFGNKIVVNVTNHQEGNTFMVNGYTVPWNIKGHMTSDGHEHAYLMPHKKADANRHAHWGGFTANGVLIAPERSITGFDEYGKPTTYEVVCGAGWSKQVCQGFPVK